MGRQRLHAAWWDALRSISSCLHWHRECMPDRCGGLPQTRINELVKYLLPWQDKSYEITRSIIVLNTIA